MSKLFIGLDLSLNSTGVCVIDEHGKLLKSETIDNNDKETFEKYHKIANISLFIQMIISNYLSNVTTNDVYVCIENYCIGNSFGISTDQIEVHGTIRTMLFDKGIFNLYLTSPKTLKNYIGATTPNKKEVINLVKEKYGHDFKKQDDEADAFILAEILRQYIVNNDKNNCEHIEEHFKRLSGNRKDKISKRNDIKKNRDFIAKEITIIFVDKCKEKIKAKIIILNSQKKCTCNKTKVCKNHIESDFSLINTNIKKEYSICYNKEKIKELVTGLWENKTFENEFIKRIK